MNSVFRKLILICIIAFSCLMATASIVKSDLLVSKQATRQNFNYIEEFSNFVIAQAPQRPRAPSRPQGQNFWQWLISLGRRGTCSDLNPTLMTFMPPAKSEQPSVEGLQDALGLTISEHPTFWFYIPSKTQENQNKQLELAEFVLQDITGKEINPPIRMSLNKMEGITSFTLPLGKTGLKEFNKPYHWYFSIICDPRRPSRNLSVDGWIERRDVRKLGLAPDFNPDILSFADLKRFAENDIWHETLTLTGYLKCRDQTNREELSNYWAELLRDAPPSIKQSNLSCSASKRPPQLQIVN